MKLLDAEKIKQDVNRSEEERKERIRKLRDEETAIVKRVNEARTNEESESKRLDELLQKKRNESIADISELDIKIASRRSELKNLMQPIDDIRKQTDEKLEKAIQRDTDSLQREEGVEQSRNILAERAKTLADRETAAMEKDSMLGKRELGIELSEAEIKRSTHDLGKKWVEFHEAVHKQNTDMEHREKEVADGKKTNEDIRAEIEKERQRTREEDRLVRDKYKALEQAKEHLGIK